MRASYKMPKWAVKSRDWSTHGLADSWTSQLAEMSDRKFGVNKCNSADKLCHPQVLLNKKQKLKSLHYYLNNRYECEF